MNEPTDHQAVLHVKKYEKLPPPRQVTSSTNLIDIIELEIEQDIQRHITKLNYSLQTQQEIPFNNNITPDIPKVSLGNKPGFAQKIHLLQHHAFKQKLEKITEQYNDKKNVVWKVCGPIHTCDALIRNEGAYRDEGTWRRSLRQHNPLEQRSPLHTHRKYVEAPKFLSYDDNDIRRITPHHPLQRQSNYVRPNLTVSPMIEQITKSNRLANATRTPSVPSSVCKVSQEAIDTKEEVVRSSNIINNNNNNNNNNNTNVVHSIPIITTPTFEGNFIRREIKSKKVDSTIKVEMAKKEVEIEKVIAATPPEDPLKRKLKRASMVRTKNESVHKWNIEMDVELERLVEIHGRKWGTIRNKLVACSHLWLTNNGTDNGTDDDNSNNKNNNENENKEKVKTEKNKIFHRIANIKTMIGGPQCRKRYLHLQEKKHGHLRHARHDSGTNQPLSNEDKQHSQHFQPNVEEMSQGKNPGNVIICVLFLYLFCLRNVIYVFYIVLIKKPCVLQICYFGI